jgi:hypothetical protein
MHLKLFKDFAGIFYCSEDRHLATLSSTILNGSLLQASGVAARIVIDDVAASNTINSQGGKFGGGKLGWKNAGRDHRTCCQS